MKVVSLERENGERRRREWLLHGKKTEPFRAMTFSHEYITLIKIKTKKNQEQGT